MLRFHGARSESVGIEASINSELASLQGPFSYPYKFRYVDWQFLSKAGRNEGSCLTRISSDSGTTESVFAEIGYPDEVSLIMPRLGACRTECPS
jgi:hypothetical protein